VAAQGLGGFRWAEVAVDVAAHLRPPGTPTLQHDKRQHQDDGECDRARPVGNPDELREYDLAATAAEKRRIELRLGIREGDGANETAG
jgi:hypothetical protein